MERFKKYVYRAAIIITSIGAIAGYMATVVIYNRIEDLEKQLLDQGQRIQQFEKMQEQVNVLEQRVNAAAHALEQYEAHCSIYKQLNGSHSAPTLENNLGEQHKKR